MRRDPCGLASLGVLLVLACGRTDAPKSAVVSSSSSASQSASQSAHPLFTYDEGTTTLSYWDSGATRVVVRDGGGERTCDGQLGDKGNMWTRADVDAAYRAPEVQAALADAGLYRAAYAERARLVSPVGTLTWVNAWKELPPDEPTAVHHLQEVLHVLLTNRVSLCP